MTNSEQENSIQHQGNRKTYEVDKWIREYETGIRVPKSKRAKNNLDKAYENAKQYIENDKKIDYYKKQKKYQEEQKKKYKGSEIQKYHQNNIDKLNDQIKDTKKEKQKNYKQWKKYDQAYQKEQQKANKKR
jgi:hypothetical protein